MTAAPLLPEVQLEEQAPDERVREFFERDRLMAAYALADLDSSGVEHARWWTASRGDDVVAGALVVEALPFRPCFATGEPEALAQILREGVREARLVLATPPFGRLAAESVYRFERLDRMHRMAVDTEAFRPRVAHRVARLGPEELEDVIDLYGPASRSYFSPQRLEREIYFGVYVGTTLVSAAGTHVRSRRSDLAAVGNVLTRMTYRSRGLATSCTSAVTEAALERHRDVVLNVRQDNTPAIAVYEKLGYRVHGPYVEGPAVRKSTLGRIFGRMR